MQRGEMVFCVLLVFVWISMGATNPPNIAESHVKHQDDSGYEHNEVNSTQNNTAPSREEEKCDVKMENDREDLTREDTNNSTSEINLPAPGYVAGYDFENVTQGFYKIHKLEDVKNWYESSQICAKEGAYLLLTNSLREAHAMVRTMAMTGTFGKWHWVGVHDSKETTVSSSNETAEEENIYKCQAVRYDIFTINYERKDCTEKNPFICEMNRSSMTSVLP